MPVRRAFAAAIGSVFALLNCNVSQAALDLFPAPFRGDPGSVYASWDFNTATNPDLADAVSFVPLGSAPLTQFYPSAELLNMGWIGAGVDGGWYGLSGSVYGLPDGGIINITMPNFIDFEPLKEVWVQIAYLPGGASPYVAAIEAQDNEVGEVYGILNGAVDYTQSGYRVESWSIIPNPDIEQIQIYVPFAVFVDSVVIDTISVPETSSLVLGATGLVVSALLIVRRHRAVKAAPISVS